MSNVIKFKTDLDKPTTIIGVHVNNTGVCVVQQGIKYRILQRMAGCEDTELACFENLLLALNFYHKAKEMLC